MIDASDDSEPSAMPVMHALSQLRAQLVVAGLAFIVLSSVGGLHDVYRNLVLDFQYGLAGLFVAVLSIMALSLSIWFSSIIMLPPIELPERPRRHGSSGLWEYFSRVLTWRESVSTHIPAAIALVVAGISILPLMGLALGLWLAIPDTPGRDAPPFSIQERPNPDQPTPQRRPEPPLVPPG